MSETRDTKRNQRNDRTTREMQNGSFLDLMVEDQASVKQYG